MTTEGEEETISLEDEFEEALVEDDLVADGAT